ncbi:MAG: substrate-binding domain-containing protein [Phototrophicaceae bacterium]
MRPAIQESSPPHLRISSLPFYFLECLILLIVVLALGCSSEQALPAITPTTNIEKVTLYTSPAMQPLLTYLVGEFTRQYALLQFEVLSLPSDTLPEHLTNRQLNYYLTSSLPNDPTLWVAPVGLDALVFIVHPSNPINSLTLAQIRGIYNGELTNWSQLGGEDGAITVYIQEVTSEPHRELSHLVLGDSPISSSARVAPSLNALAQQIATDPHAIGYVNLSQLPTGVKALALEQSHPTYENVAQLNYPLRLNLYLVGLQEPINLYRLFVGWLQGGSGQAYLGAWYTRPASS